MRSSFVIVLASCYYDACQAEALQCEVCQLLCVLIQEALEDLAPKSRLDIAAGASKVVAAAAGKNSPCKNAAIWQDSARKIGADVTKIQLVCRREVERLEEDLEIALGDPTVRDGELRLKTCGAAARKPVCDTLWLETEVPVSKNRAMQLREAAKSREDKEGAENDRKANLFFMSNKDRLGVESLASGLQIKVLHQGHGRGPPSIHQKVTLHYRGLLIDCVPQDGPLPCKGGTEFDSTFACKRGTPSSERQACEKNKPISFTADQAGTFWLEILPRMFEGSRVEVYVPYKLAYGAAENPSKRPALVGPRAALIFQVDLLSILGEAKKGSTIVGANTTYEIVARGGDDGVTVQMGDVVTVHATGSIIASGKTFWSTRGQKPFTYTAGGEVIRGWDLGAQGMQRGEIRQLRIPSDEGYGAAGFPSWDIPPHADLLFELEVLEIEKRQGEL